MKFEGLSKSQEEMKPEFKLYDVIETDDGYFDAVLPGLFDNKRGAIIGISRQRFKSREEAEKVINLSRENSKVMFERSSLEKSFTEHFYRINKTEDGNYKVMIPGLRDSKTGYYVGTTSKEFGSWNEARDFYLKQLESKSILTEHPILEVKTGEDEQISFSDFDSFNPIVALSKKPRDIPQSVEKYILQRERMAGEAPSASTYQETIKEEGWERKIYSFVSIYLEKEGKNLAEELGIKNLELLTSRQAVDLTTRLVVELTKYKWSETEEEQGHDLLVSRKLNADQSTTLKLLQEGLINKGNPNWEGNGVCRKFASMTKAVFESLKANQTMFNYLQDTYCLYDNGMDEFDPKCSKKNVINLVRSGHAWNTFVTVSKKEANVTIIDTTWAKRNLDTGKIGGLDYTLTRMEPVIHQIATELPEDAPNRDIQLEHIFSYYQLKMESLSQTELDISPIDKLNTNEKLYYKRVAEENFGKNFDLSQMNEDQLLRIGYQFMTKILRAQKQKTENQFFSSRILDILKKQKKLPKIPANLLKIVGEEYKLLAKDADSSEIEVLWQVSKQYSKFPFNDILKNYLKGKNNSRELLFLDDKLQQAVFEQIKTQSNFKKFINNSSSFRIRIRELLPELFIDFSPGTKASDARELKYLIDKSNFLRSGYLFNIQHPNEESATRFFTKARETLRKINPEMYEQVAKDFDNFELVKNYDSLYLQLASG